MGAGGQGPVPGRGQILVAEVTVPRQPIHPSERAEAEATRALNLLTVGSRGQEVDQPQPPQRISRTGARLVGATITFFKKYY